MQNIDIVKKNLERLRSKLLDLSTTNRMLSYKHPRVSCVRVVDEHPEYVFARLMAGDTLHFAAVPEPTYQELTLYGEDTTGSVPRTGNPATPSRPDAITHAKKIGIRVQYDLPIDVDDFEGDPKHRDNLLQTLDYADALDARLRKIRATGRTAIEESGANMLYLAFGFLEWKDVSTSKSHQAPLVLVPVELIRQPFKGGYRTSVKWTGDELQPNLSLRKKLEEFTVDLPFIEEDQALEDYFDKVTKIVHSKLGWQVRRYLTLGLFEFGKILLYLDLDPSRWPTGSALENHPLVQRVLTGDDEPASGDARPSGNIDPNAAALFRDLKLDVVDRADSSQCEALQVALEGRNLVIQGPPGTGKSQTITNLIAAAMAKGMKVLFVAEKMAALEVVRRRLRELGLGHFCLELHSHKSRKAEVLEDIGDTLSFWASRRGNAEAKFDKALQQLESRHRLLSDYIDAISAPAGQLSGWTISDALMAAGRHRRVLGNKTGTFDKVSATFKGETITLAQIDDAKSRMSVVLSAMADLVLSANASEHPWAGVSGAKVLSVDTSSVVELATSWADKADSLLKTFEDSRFAGVEIDIWPNVPTTIAELKPVWQIASIADQTLDKADAVTGWTTPRCAEGVIQTVSLLDIVTATPFKTLDLRTEAILEADYEARTQTLHSRIEELRQQQSALQEIFRESAFNASPDDLEEWAAAFAQSSLFARLGQRWKAAHAGWLTLCRPAKLKSKANERRVQLEMLRAFVLTKRALDSDTGVIELVGTKYSGLETRTLDLVQLGEWAQQVRTTLSAHSASVLMLGNDVLATLKSIGDQTDCASLAEKFADLQTKPSTSVWNAVVSARLTGVMRDIVGEVRSQEVWTALESACERSAAAARKYIEARDAFITFTNLDQTRWFASSAPSLEGIAKRARHAVANAEQLSRWLAFDKALKASQDQIEAPILELAIKGEIELGDSDTGLDYLVCDTLARWAYKSNPQLRVVTGRSLTKAREEYAALDAEVMELRRTKIAAEICRAQLPAGKQSGVKSQQTEMALIKAELSKQKKHIPIRQLMLRAGNAIQTLKPCFMMGPLSVAQYIAPGELSFDLIIMDEASQMKPEDAIGVLARGKQAVVVGDTKQLPPTSFFDSLSDDNEDDDDEDMSLAEDSNSILELASAIFDERMLKWHYRSRHGSLIAFSNRQFYKNELVVFPSPRQHTDKLGIGWNPVEDGVTEKGVNAEEARTVAKAAADFIVKYPDRTLGVVAMNAKQSQRIADELANLANGSRLIGDAAAKAEAHTSEPFFIKNLENVQGDERDVIMISMTYGPTKPGGPTPQNFGPINQKNGWRRLNVLFTRAKERMEIFSSMEPSAVVPKEGADLGPRALKDFLTYAKTGVLGAEAKLTGKGTDNDFEDAVIEGLQQYGFTCTPQLGVANFYLDIAISDPDKPGEFLAAVECDGAAYHSSKSARDRDRLRQEILEGLGWNIIRIWSTDWFHSPQEELERVVEQLNYLRQNRNAPKRVVAPVIHDQPLEGPALIEEDEPEIEKQAAPVAKRVTRSVRAISRDQARARLIDIREHKIRSAFPEHDPTEGFLRKSMLDALLKYRPVDHEEFLKLIPQPMRVSTNPEQIKQFGDDVFEILALIRD
ncbi:DUF4011 domain-containing protein [Brevundimonas sp.]|uniref:DUF4011 domain-containing protein n=1 Tax=Brevundimonas sp. TaxID=1871086 RepID=UPI00289EC80A|nr:DUF4011 domain-containing protein [Brevundimonas sp.]